ncbi:MAG: GNAT family N-acetyltransferase [Pirellulaceae bacterium]
MHKLDQSRREDNRIDAASLQIRLAKADDIPTITEIFNHAIEHTTASFFTEPRTVEQQTAWFQEHGNRFPVLVAESNAKVVGWGSLDRWSPRQGYRITGEVSFYVHPEFHRRGIGRKLVESLIEQARQNEFVSVIAKISGGNMASIKLVKSLGFCEAGRLVDVGQKFGTRLDVLYFQRQL